jgi:hypothetical protein
LDHPEAFSAGGLVEPVIQTHEFERGGFVFCGDDRGRQLQAIGGPEWMHPQEALGRAAHCL